MVTTTAPPPFLTRISAGTEDPRRLPSTLLQHLRRGDNNCENQPSCCLAGPGGSARPALKRVRRRKGKIRPGPAGLLPSRYQQFQQHRAGLGRRTPLGAHGPAELGAPVASTVSAAPGFVATPAEESLAPTPSRPAPSRPLRKEVRRGFRVLVTFLPFTALRSPLGWGGRGGGGRGAAGGLPPPFALCVRVRGGGRRVSVTFVVRGGGGRGNE